MSSWDDLIFSWGKECAHILYSLFFKNFISEMCKMGAYHDIASNTCKNCSRNFYQDQAGQTSCKACPASVNMYTLSEGSTSQTQCVCKFSVFNLALYKIWWNYFAMTEQWIFFDIYMYFICFNTGACRCTIYKLINIKQHSDSHTQYKKIFFDV